MVVGGTRHWLICVVSCSTISWQYGMIGVCFTACTFALNFLHEHMQSTQAAMLHTIANQ